MFRDAFARAMRAMRSWKRPRKTAIELRGCRPLHAGGMLYVTDIDRRRFVFVTTPRAACLLASYRVPNTLQRVEEEGTGSGV
jgi:hypothetical protein